MTLELQVELRQVQKCGGVKLVNGTPSPLLLIVGYQTG